MGKFLLPNGFLKSYLQGYLYRKQNPFFNKENTPIKWLGKVGTDIKKRGVYEGLHDITYPITTSPYIDPLMEPLTSAIRVANYKTGRKIPFINKLLGQQDWQMAK